MNKLPFPYQVAAINALVEGNSIRSTERMIGVHRDTIMRLAIRVGEACATALDERMHTLKCKHLQLDELWCYVGKKQRRVREEDDPSQVGDFWTFIALDGETKLVPCFRVGKRDETTTRAFVEDLSSRLSGRVQLSSDMMRHYASAIEQSFGGNVDYGQIVKHYEAEQIGPGRYSPPEVVSVERRQITGRPKRISTSHVERVNLTVRMQMRRFTRLTNGFSKRADSLRAAVALHFAHYNLARIHSSLRTTPAQAAGIESKAWTVADLVSLAN